MLLAGDIGGTKSRLAVFRRGGDLRAPLSEEVLPSARFSGIEALLREFLNRCGLCPDSAALALAGPVIDGRAAVTNLPWRADAEAIGQAFGFSSVLLLNDLEATAQAVPLLIPAELHTLCPGEGAARGAMAVIAPGTGLGEAFLTWEKGRYRARASEGGHGDFAPANALEADLLRNLRARMGHVSYETVCSGPGIVRLYRFLRDRTTKKEPPWLAERLAEAADAAPVIVDAALTEKEALCVRTVRLFVSILGAEAGNLALKTLATAGVYLGGGMAPRLLSFLEEESFLSSFRRKGPMTELLSRVPVQVIVEPRAALMGAAARGMAEW
jgi:glucokinase